MFSNFSWDDVVDGLDEGLDVVKTVAPLAGMPAMGAVAGLLDKVVESKNKNVKIDNSDTIQLLETIAKSTGNDLDDDIICVIKALMECKAKRK